MSVGARGLEKVGQRRVAVERESGKPVVLFLRQLLWSTRPFAAAGAQTVGFFTGAITSPLASNLALPNQIPSPSSFDIFSWNLYLSYGMAEADVVLFYNNALFDFAISKKPFLQAPAAVIPAGTAGLYGFCATLAVGPGIFHACNGIPSAANTYAMDINGLSIYLPSQQDFTAVVTTFNAGAFGAVFNATVAMNGIQSTPVL